MTIGKKLGSVKSLKESLKRGAGGGTFIKYVPKGQGDAPGTMTVRFLEDPVNWINYYEHWDTTMNKSYPCIEDNCPGCATDERRSSRYLANALDVENDRVVPLQMPKTLVSTLVTMYERMDTLLDRDFELIRSGDGLDTTYNAIPEAPLKRKMDKYEKHDLEKVLNDAFQSAFGTDEATEEETVSSTETAKKGRGRPAGSKNKPKAEPQFTPDVDVAVDQDDDVPVPEDEEVETEADADPSEGEDFYTEEELQTKPLGELRSIARDYGINTKGLNKIDLIEAILTPDDE